MSKRVVRPIDDEDIAYDLDRVSDLTSIGRTTIFRMIKEGQLPAKKVRNRTVVLRSDLIKFFDRLSYIAANA